MKFSKRARRGIRIFSRIQTAPKRFVYLLSQTKLEGLKEKTNELIRAGREGNDGPITATDIKALRTQYEFECTEDAIAPREVQHDLHDGNADDSRGTPDAEEIAPPVDPRA